MTGTPARADTGNRAFWQLTGATLAGSVLFTAGVGCVAYIVTDRLAGGGSSGEWLTLAPGMALVAIAVVSLALAVGRMVVELWRMWHLWRELQAHRLDLPADLRALADQVGLSERLDLVPAGETFAFTYGFWQPRVALSSAAHVRMAPQELRSVLVHERSHARSRDPLKMLTARVLLARALYLPALGHLHGRFLAGRELAADRAALAACGRKPLAGALLKVAAEPAWAATGLTAAIAGPGMLQARVLQLERGQEPELDRASPGVVLSSLAGVALAAWAVAGSAALLLRFCNGC